MLDPLPLNGKVIKMIDVLHSNDHIPHWEMKGQSGRVPPLKKCDQKRVVPMDVVHKGPHPKDHSTKKCVATSNKKLSSLLEDGCIVSP